MNFKTIIPITDDMKLDAMETQNDPYIINDGHVSVKTNSIALSDSDTDIEHDDDHEEDEEDEKEEGESSDKTNDTALQTQKNSFYLRTIFFIVASTMMFGILFTTVGVLQKNDHQNTLRNNKKDVMDQDDFFESDPHGGMVISESSDLKYHWFVLHQTGLDLMILNALTDDWQKEFQTAVTQWDNGKPDALTLQTERVDVDVECEPSVGFLKVCNGDYGATDWRGINLVLLDTQKRWIFASTVKMNEYFLAGASAAQRQYTMCHELGHGFGLPHWDTDMHNANMGNCMDYTDRPKTNQQPDTSNFNFLKDLYGEVGTSLQDIQSAEMSLTLPNGENNKNETYVMEEKTDEGNVRSLRGYGTTTKEGTGVPETVMSAYRSILKNREYKDLVLKNESRHLEDSDVDNNGILIDLGYENYGVLVYKLRVSDQTR